VTPSRIPGGRSPADRHNRLKKALIPRRLKMRNTVFDNKWIERSS
jgi:hypothetical protein